MLGNIGGIVAVVFAHDLSHAPVLPVVINNTINEEMEKRKLVWSVLFLCIMKILFLFWTCDFSLKRYVKCEFTDEETEV